MKLSELYTSIQGEGPNVGLPTQFVRFGGCNMRCALWPCDSPYAIFPEYRHEWEDLTWGALVERIPLYPNHICFTGGEPFIQKNLEEVVVVLSNKGFTMDFFTNGSFIIPGEIQTRHNVTIVLDYKLPGSGEAERGLENRRKNFRKLWPKDALKFTVASREDLLAAQLIYKQRASAPQVYVGPVWGKIEAEEVAQFILDEELDWKLNVQTHKFIWDPEARRI